MSRFSRIEKLIGKEKLNKLQNSKVTVIGLGAVGSYAVEGLARAGVGKLILVDFDKISLSNINRQLYALESTIGKNKAEVAKARVKDINPDCQVEAYVKFVDAKTRVEILADRPDLVIDAIDSLSPKIGLLQYCYENNIPVISSMGAALRTDPTKIRVADLMDTKECPLAAQVRRKLRKLGVGRGIQVVYSTEKVDFRYEEPQEPDYLPRGRARRVLGSLPTLTGIFGLFIATLAIERLINSRS